MPDDLPDLLRDISHGFRRQLQELAPLGDLGLAPFQARLLNIVGRHPGLSQNSLADATGRDKAQIARATKELETRGLLARTPHETDWRTQRLTLTPEGESASARIDAVRAELAARMLGQLSASEQAELFRLLSKLKRALGD